ncbi:hypothetical protein ACET3X_003718 [Alternaria dauci]|uniref:DJ-1/PfpI domain-containing protein n=1 Tax=Alternaria dauci TaxID=48095 RepID=A0ABR3ULL3_9PLEO
MTTASAKLSPGSGTNGTPNPSAVKPPFFDVNGKKPIHYGVLLFPGFQALDVFGPLDVFNSLSMLYHFPTRLTMLAADSEPVETSHQRAGNQMFSHPETNVSQSLMVDRTFREQLEIQEAGAYAEARGGAIDVLIVPGGVGTRNNMEAEIEFVKHIYPNLKALLCVCTGATILARAGVLDGRRATTNKRAYTWATSTGPNVNWVAEARWVVDGNIVTGSGISAGIDATYAFVGLNYGETIAQELADSADPLLLIIRAELGPDWCFYKEFLEFAVAATTNGEDISTWVRHIEPLVRRPSLLIAHEGVLFLLSELGVTQRSKPPPSTNMAAPALFVNSRPSLPTSPSSNMQHDLRGGHMPMASSQSTVNTRPPPSTPPPNNMQRSYARSQAPMAPFGFDPPKPPAFASTNIYKPPAPRMASFSYDYSKKFTEQPASANFSLPSAASVAFSSEKHHITVEPFRTAYSSGFALHQDPAFKQDIREFFGHAYPVGQLERNCFSQYDVPPVYKAADDDLAVWRTDGGAEDAAKKSGGKGFVKNKLKSLEDKGREDLLESMRHKLFKEDAQDTSLTVWPHAKLGRSDGWSV